MRCPRGDGELIARSATGLGDIPLTYHLCLGCLGHWTRPFDANYLPLSALPESRPQEETSSSFRCPECQEPLERAHEDAMAPEVLAWYCPTGHGYFFPGGNLRKFRLSQEARVTYHKLWNIPMPPLRTVLLASIVLVAAVASVVTLSQLKQSQSIETQAREVITYHDAIVKDRGVTVIARTNVPTILALTIWETGLDAEMNSPDGRTHSLTLYDLEPGLYSYSFHFTRGNVEIRGETFTFTVSGPSGAN